MESQLCRTYQVLRSGHLMLQGSICKGNALRVILAVDASGLQDVRVQEALIFPVAVG